MRGSRFHSKVLLNEDIGRGPIKSNGRDPLLIEKRNIALFHRYCFFSLNTNNRYEVIIERLSDEFYLSKITVGKLIALNTELILSIKKEKLGVNTLKKMHPQFDWTITKSHI